VFGLPESHKGDKTLKLRSDSQAACSLLGEPSSITTPMELGEVEVGSSQRDLFVSQPSPAELSPLQHLMEKQSGKFTNDLVMSSVVFMDRICIY
ncbi:hypothetical protein SK128_006220, partial [Halocaridina rubra]